MTNISAKINYNNQTIDVSVSSSTITQFYMTGYYVTAINSDGILIGTSNTLQVKSLVAHGGNDPLVDLGYVAHAQIPFGIQESSDGYAQNTSATLKSCDMLHVIAGFTNDNIQTVVKTPIQENKLQAPLLITGGDSVFFGRVSSVANKRLITYTGQSYNLNNAQSVNFAGDLLYIFSGSGQGTYATITSTGTTNKLYVDKNFTDCVGGYFKIFPRRNITGNSSWNITDVDSDLYLDSTIYSGLSYDSITPTVVNYIALGAASGYPYLVNPVMKSLTSYGGMEVSFPSPTGWGKDSVRVGDLIHYRSYDTPALLNQTAVVYHITTGTTSNTSYVYAYPSGVFSNLEGYTDAKLVRANQYKVMTYPKFGEDILLVVHSNSSVLATERVKAPSAKIYLNANDYDSAFGTVSDRSHFHMGPVVLSNGEILTNHELIISGSLYNSDPTQSNPDKSWTSFATQDSSAAEYISGEYFKNGIFVGTYNQSFISSEMLTVRVKGIYGTAVVENSITIPVQPSA